MTLLIGTRPQQRGGHGQMGEAYRQTAGMRHAVAGGESFQYTRPEQVGSLQGGVLKKDTLQTFQRALLWQGSAPASVAAGLVAFDAGVVRHVTFFLPVGGAVVQPFVAPEPDLGAIGMAQDIVAVDYQIQDGWRAYKRPRANTTPITEVHIYSNGADKAISLWYNTPITPVFIRSGGDKAISLWFDHAIVPTTITSGGDKAITLETVTTPPTPAYVFSGGDKILSLWH